MAKKKMYTFSERRHSRKGITSTVLGEHFCGHFYRADLLCLVVLR